MRRSNRAEWISTLIGILVLASVVYATVAVKQVAVVGGAGRRLSTLLANANYTNSSGVLELKICNPQDAAGTLYVGGASNVNAANGGRLIQGQCIPFSATGATGDTGVKTDDFWLFTSANQNAEIWLRTR